MSRRSAARRPLGTILASVGAFGAVIVAVLPGGATGAPGEPTNTTPPIISGTAEAGSTLTTSDGTWAGLTPITMTYQWQRCQGKGDSNCNDIPTATNKTYTPTSADVGLRIRSIVTAANTAG